MDNTNKSGTMGNQQTPDLSWGSIQYNQASQACHHTLELLEKRGINGTKLELGFTHTDHLKPLKQLLQELHLEYKNNMDPEDLPTDPWESLESFFTWARESHHDLWSTEIPGAWFLSQFEFTSEHSENIKLGIQLALLSYHYKIDPSYFSNFDT